MQQCVGNCFVDAERKKSFSVGAYVSVTCKHGYKLMQFALCNMLKFLADFVLYIVCYVVSAFGYQKVLLPIDFADIFDYLWYTGSAKKNVVF